MNRPKSLAATALAVLFLAACSSGGGLGDILGGGGNQASNYEIRGTVDHVDTNSRSIYLTNASGLTSMLSNSGTGSGNSVRIYYDNQTTVSFQGQSHRPENLERGDEVTVRVSESSNNTLMADTMTVTHDSSGGVSSSSGVYGSMLRGTVAYVDASRRTIEVNRGVGSNVIVEYSTSTPVYFNGQTYRPADLERGDEIEINVRDLGSNRFSASDITVIRSVSGSSSSSSSSSLQTVRGTVSYVDVNRRTIELESASWISRFNSGTGSTGSRITVSYDNNVSVDVNGRLHPVSGLERGDVVEVQIDNYNNTMRATRIILVRDINDLR
jgi:predicted RNA-binding protein with TRAM domain